jgi:endonuclease YncB( thermonuclease family)
MSNRESAWIEQFRADEREAREAQRGLWAR